MVAYKCPLAARRRVWRVLRGCPQLSNLLCSRTFEFRSLTYPSLGAGRAPGYYAPDGGAGGGSKVEVALASTHSLFDDATRDSRLIGRSETSQEYTAIAATAPACNSVSLAHELGKPLQCHKLALDITRTTPLHCHPRHIAPRCMPTASSRCCTRQAP